MSYKKAQLSLTTNLILVRKRRAVSARTARLLCSS